MTQSMLICVFRMLLGPPIGGALYSRFDFRAPFVFTIIITVVDLIGRLLLIERKDALKYGHDPAEVSAKVEEEHHRAHAIGKKSCLEGEYSHVLTNRIIQWLMSSQFHSSLSHRNTRLPESWRPLHLRWSRHVCRTSRLY